jgi:hypothetical protein
MASFGGTSWKKFSPEVKGGKVCININGKNGSYFKTHRRLRPRDPLSPLVFNLVADALAYIMEQAKDKGHTRGVVPHLVEGGLTHLQYADDTVLLCPGDTKSITNLKYLLYCFEWLSSLKINYHKSEMVHLEWTSGRKKGIANMLNC